MDKVPKAGSSTWVENFLLLANETVGAISSMVGAFTEVLPTLYDSMSTAGALVCTAGDLRIGAVREPSNQVSNHPEHLSFKIDNKLHSQIATLKSTLQH